MKALLLCLLVFAGLASAEPRGKLPAPLEQAVAAAEGDRKAAIIALEAAANGASEADRPWIQLHAGEQRRLAGDAGGARRWFEVARSASEESVRQAAAVGLALLDAAGASLSEPARRVLVEAPERLALASQSADRHLALARFAPSDEARARHARLAVEQAPTAGHQARQVATLTAAGIPLPESVLPKVEEVPEGPHVPGKVGTLLPLTGRFASVGSQVRDALELGWREGQGRQPLVHEDSGGGAASAVAALRRLVEQHHVTAVLGPLLSEETEAVAAEADRLGVPLIVLSQGAEDPTRWRWVVQGWLTPSQQVDVLVAHAVTQRGWSRFAILAPDSTYGQTAAARFQEAVTRHGGQIAISLTYPSEATSLRDIALKLARKGSDGGQPIVDYDALFVPDRARQIPLVAAALAVEDVPLGNYKPYEAGPVAMLGLSGWNSWDLVTGGGAYVAGGLYTDVFLPPPDTGFSWQPVGGWRDFVTRYREVTGRTPTAVEALASDAGAIVAIAARDAPPTRKAFLAALLAVERSTSTTGALRFDPVLRMLQHRIEVISVSRSGLVPVERP